VTWTPDGEYSDDLQYVKNSLDVPKTFLKIAIDEQDGRGFYVARVVRTGLGCRDRQTPKMGVASRIGFCRA
jgi:hypothetical protein